MKETIKYRMRSLHNLYQSSHSQVVAIGIFLFAAIIAGFIIGWLEQARLEIERVHISDRASDNTAAIQHTVERALSVTYALAALVNQGNGKIDNFNDIASKMLPMYLGVDSLQLAPNGVVQKIVPLEGNEKAIGHDLFKDNERSAEAILTRDSDQLTFAGPFKTIQGSFLGGVGRLPVFLHNEDGNSYFWGFVNVMIRFPDVLKSTGLFQLEEKGFAYQLWRYHPKTGQKQIIAESSAALASDPVERYLYVPNATWMLSITPIKGWGDPYGLSFKILLGLTFSLLLAWLAKLMVDLKIRETELKRIALLDELTGLPNRRLMLDRLEQALAHAHRDGKLVAVCYLDIDNFKCVNDNLGHDVGDQLLVEMARNIKACLREIDTLARIGGDEFVIVLQEIEDVEECKKVLNRILQVTTIPIFSGDKRVLVSASIGTTLYPKDDSDTDILLRHADYAMYKAKQSGKGRYCLFDKNESASL
ncbi:MAG: diguanylate cyclase with Chase sensor [Firmicutes bacterium]|nr:diguanylate cyclase with Chase sensor [Bacillota bacterium]